MKKNLLLLLAFSFTCAHFSIYVNYPKTVFAVESAFSPIFLETSGTKEITTPTNLSVFYIKDESRTVIQENTIYALKLDNGFIFQNKPEILTSGKYREKVYFEIDEQNPSIAYLTIQEKTNDSDGVIEFRNLDVAPTKVSELDKDVFLSLSGSDTYDTIKVGTYKEAASTRKEIKIETLEGGKKPSATGISAPNRKLQICIDDEEYGTVTAGDNGIWNYVFPYKYSSFEAGTHTFTIGYYQGTEKPSFAVSQTFEIAEEAPKTTATVTFTIGDTSYNYDGRKGYMESPPFIDDNGRVLLPLRAVAATLGISSQNIVWDSTSQMIHITYQTKEGQSQTVVYKIGSNTATINGISSEMDTAPIIKDGITFLPLRPLLHSLGITDDNIQWDEDLLTVSYEAERI